MSADRNRMVNRIRSPVAAKRMSGLEGLLAGRTLVDRYRIEEVIGRGGMGAVYRATDERLGRAVAVKVISAPASEPEVRDELRARFHREARVAAGIRHPNVVTVYDFGTDTLLGLDFLVMELLEGENLATRLAGGGAPPLPVSLHVLRDAARGLAAGHRVGLVHRDVKPANIFLEEESGLGELRVLVLDFGIAQVIAGEEAVTRLTRIGGGPLSPAYASPEQLRGERNLTPASDVFSLGVIGVELLTGERMFARNGADRLAGTPPNPAVPPLAAQNPAVSPELEEVLRRALSPEPDARFSHAGVFAEALDAASRVPIVVVPPEPLPPAAPHPEPTRTLAAPDLPPPVVAEAPTVLRPQPEPAPAEPVPVEFAPAESPTGSPAARSVRRRPGVGWLLVTAFGGIAALIIGWALLGRDSAGGSRDPIVAASPEVVLPEPTAPAVPNPAEPTGTTPPEAPPPEEASPLETDSGEGAVGEGDPSPAASVEGERSASRMNQEGVRQFEQGELASARQQLQRATELAPGNAEFRNNYAWVLFRLGETEAALRELERTLELNPRREIAYANLGEVRLVRGDTAGAIAAYERFLELNSNARRGQIAEAKLRTLRGPR